MCRFFFHFKNVQPREIRPWATKGFAPHPRENFVDIFFFKVYHLTRFLKHVGPLAVDSIYYMS